MTRQANQAGERTRLVTLGGRGVQLATWNTRASKWFYEPAPIKEGTILEWENGLGGTEREIVFRSKRTGNLAVHGALSSEISVYGLAQIDNGLRIMEAK